MPFKKHQIWFGLILICVSTLSCQLPTRDNPAEETIRPTTAHDLRRLPTQAAQQPSTQLENGDQLVRHPSQTFEAVIPAGWDIELDENGSLFASEPQGEGTIYVTVNYTVHPLTADDFERYTRAREENFFNYFEDYTPGEFEINATKDWAVYRKRIDFNGIPETVDTYYYRLNDTVFTIDTWMETSRISEYEALYAHLLDQFSFQSEGAQDFYPYNYVWVYRDNLDLFSFEIPVSWAYQVMDIDGGLEDQFWAPDEKAALTHFLIYQAGSQSETDLETKIIQRLQTSFPNQTTGMTVTSREEIENGLYQLTWASEADGWQGMLIYQVYQNKLLILNGMYAAELEESYRSTIQYGLDYYAVPAVEEE